MTFRGGPSVEDMAAPWRGSALEMYKSTKMNIIYTISNMENIAYLKEWVP